MFWTDRTVDVSSVFPYPNEPMKRRLHFWLLFRCVVYTCRRNLLPRTWHARLPVPVVLRIYRARHALRDRSSYALHGRSSVVLRRHCSSSTVSLRVGRWRLSRIRRWLRPLLLRTILQDDVGITEGRSQFDFAHQESRGRRVRLPDIDDRTFSGPENGSLRHDDPVLIALKGALTSAVAYISGFSSIRLLATSTRTRAVRVDG